MHFSISLIQTLKDFQLQPYPSVTGLPQPITIRSISYFLFALIWAWLLLVNFTGWGRLTGKLLRVQCLPSSVACSLGIAVIVFLGGWLNLLHAIYPRVLFALIAAGLVLYFLLRKERPESYRWLNFWTHSSRSSKLLLLLALITVSLRVAATIRLGMFNNLDDNAAYMVFPKKMLEMHHFAFDPFSDRRVISSLGGSYLLQDFFLAATSLTHVAMADRTLGMILLGGIIFDLGIAFSLSISQIALLEFLVYLVPAETINLTFIILPISLLLAMAWTIAETPKKHFSKMFRHAFIVGMIGGVTVSLKSTYLPVVGLFLIIPYWTMSAKSKIRTAMQLLLVAGLGTITVLAAWMIAMKLTSGTYLFPVLGHGVDYSSYGILQIKHRFHSHRIFFKIFLQAIALLILAVLQFFTGNKGRRLEFGVGILIASAIAITAFNYKSGGDFIWRYNFPQFFCAVIIFYIANSRNIDIQPNSGPGHLTFYVAIFSLIAMIFYYDAAGKNPHPFRQVDLEWHDYRPSLRASLSGLHLEDPQINEEYSAVENSLPRNGPALENTAYPFLFDYRKHKIFVADWPGAASPAKAWPLQAHSGPLQRYLSENSVRYVIYDYGYARWIDVQACQALENPLLNSEELMSLWLINILTHHQFDHLQASYRSIYDDGKIAVIDLDHPKVNAPVDSPAWTLSTNKNEMCSAVMARYLKSSSPVKAGKLSALPQQPH